MGVNSNGTTLMDQGVFQNIGSVTWDTTAKTTGFTAVSGNGYFVNTTSGAITVTLPSSPSAGDVVGIKDYANTADTNNITLGRNGSNIDGVANDAIINTEGLSALIVYVDATKGWLITNSSQANDISGPTYIVATGGTITCCGDYKIHTFTGPGTFCVSAVGNPAGSTSVDYLVVAGGGGGGGDGGGGGGAGGYRTSFPSPAGTTPVTVQGYPITVGGGGTGQPKTSGTIGCSGSNSVFSTITSAGGGGGGNKCAFNGGSGGSGGGGRAPGTGGTGNTPPVSPPQGNPGGSVPGSGVGGTGGGGASCAGTPNPLSFPASGSGTAGGAGSTNCITGSPTSYSGGGGGGGNGGGSSGGTGGTGGGGNGAAPCGQNGFNGTVNTGGGAGGGSCNPASVGGTGGSGIVIIRYKYQ